MATTPRAAPDWTYPYEPQPKQALAHRTWAAERLFGGAAGPGKTEWLMAEVLRPVLSWGVNGLLLRRTFPDLAQPKGIIERLLERIPAHVGRYNETKHYWRFRNGAILQLGYLANDKDVQRYVGAEYGVIGWDQVEHFTEWQYRRLWHPLRAGAAEHAGFIPYMVATANPGGPGHHWVKRRWIDPAPPYVVWQPEPTIDEPDPGSRAFIPGSVDDNKYLGPDYHRRLAMLPPDEYQALRWGNWDVYAGARFSSWNRNVHVIDPEDFPVPPGAGVPRGMAVDYGMDAPWCALWGALFPDGLVVIYRELYQAGLTPAEQASLIREVETGAGERSAGRPMPSWLDPACWARPPDQPAKAPQRVSGPGAVTVGDTDTAAPSGSIADTYYRHGVAARKANNDRLTGTARIADKLRVRADGRPRLLIYSNCLNLIRTLPGLPRDKKNPELYDTNGEDHAADTLRYLLMGLDPGGGPVVAGPGPESSAGASPRSTTAGLRKRGF